MLSMYVQLPTELNVEQGSPDVIKIDSFRFPIHEPVIYFCRYCTLCLSGDYRSQNIIQKVKGSQLQASNYKVIKTKQILIIQVQSVHINICVLKSNSTNSNKYNYSSLKHLKLSQTHKIVPIYGMLIYYNTCNHHVMSYQDKNTCLP